MGGGGRGGHWGGPQEGQGTEGDHREGEEGVVALKGEEEGQGRVWDLREVEGGEGEVEEEEGQGGAGAVMGQGAHQGGQW